MFSPPRPPRPISAASAYSPAGLTLVETLAVVVVLALTASLGAVGLAGATAQSRVRGAESVLRDADARARLHAGAGSPVALSLGPDRDVIAVRPLVPGRFAEAQSLVRSELPPHVRADLLDTDGVRPLDHVVFDAAGRSPDYVFLLTGPDGRRARPVSGLTGWVFESEALP